MTTLLAMDPAEAINLIETVLRRAILQTLSANAGLT
jgi:hypothetical protein